VLEERELPTLMHGLEVLHYQEGWLESGRHEARVVARRAVGERGGDGPGGRWSRDGH
jgi:hypothetical protein